MNQTLNQTLIAPLNRLGELGGPVVLILLALSVLALSVVLAKGWQFLRLGVGRHDRLDQALVAWDRGEAARARSALTAARTHLAPLALTAMQAAPDAAAGRDLALRARLTGMAEARIADLSSGLRLLDSIAQIAPLLGLFGTVLGMIEAFQTLQAAGQAVDPAALAGGIWVALLTTAVGLGVAMPAALLLSWFDGRIAAEARMAGRLIDCALCAGLDEGNSVAPVPDRMADPTSPPRPRHA